LYLLLQKQSTITPPVDELQRRLYSLRFLQDSRSRMSVQIPNLIPSAEMDQPLIVCFHGSQSCSKMLMMELAPFLLKSNAKFAFLPGDIVPMNQYRALNPHFSDLESDAFRQLNWINRAPDDSFDLQLRLKGILTRLKDEIKSSNRVGLLGYSQGASVIAALPSLGDGFDELQVKFIISLSYMDSGWRKHVTGLTNHMIKVPSLLIRGKADPFPAEHASSYEELFECPDVLHHSGGHLPLPGDAQEIETLVNRMTNFVDAHSM